MYRPSIWKSSAPQGTSGKSSQGQRQQQVVVGSDDTIGESVERRFRSPEQQLVEQREFRSIQRRRSGGDRE